jgi:hypothetical protein
MVRLFEKQLQPPGFIHSAGCIYSALKAQIAATMEFAITIDYDDEVLY